MTKHSDRSIPTASRATFDQLIDEMKLLKPEIKCLIYDGTDQGAYNTLKSKGDIKYDIVVSHWNTSIEYETLDGVPIWRRAKYDINDTEIMSMLSDNGIGFVPIYERQLLFGTSDTEAKLIKSGFHISGYLGVPIGYSWYHENAKIVFCIVTRVSYSHFDYEKFLIDISDGSFDSVTANNILNRINTKNVSSGIVYNWFDKLEKKNTESEKSDNFILPSNLSSYHAHARHSSFRGFEQFKLTCSIDNLETEFKNFRSVAIARLGSTKSIDQKLVEDTENSIYVSRHGMHPIATKIDEMVLSPSSYLKVKLNDRLILNDYAKIFFDSKIGNLIRQRLFAGGFVKKLRIEDLRWTEILVPSLDKQIEIIETNRKLRDLKSSIENIENEVSLNPGGSGEINDKLNGMLLTVGGLTKAERVRSLVGGLEDQELEFKETFSLDVKSTDLERKNRKNADIEKSSLKAIVGFLNQKHPATLLIGVTDAEKQIVGINTEIDKFHSGSTDKFLLYFGNKIKDRIGERVYPNINYEIIDVSGKLVLVCTCEPAPQPCFLDNNEFWWRTPASTRKLEGNELVEVLRRRFPAN